MRFAHFLKSLLASFLILALVACAPTAKREGTGEYIDDALITTKVKAALAADPNVKATEVNVETFKGMVQLSGFVSTKDSIQKAIDIARGVSGVRGVKNDMTVK
ncbi:MAG: BON domain-containing protein [Pseudomonadota bacterium]|nr:BON domain-containing protein [Pseudomonadota bacterium]